MSRTSPLIALISATPAAIPPAVAAFAELYPEARLWNILDDRLLQDANEQGSVTQGLADRMTRLISHAATEGADGILLTCSMYGAVAHAVGELGIPIYAPDDAVFDAALTGGYSTLLLISSGAGPLADSEHRLAQAAVERGIALDIGANLSNEAFAATSAGDMDALYSALESTIVAAEGRPDAILLAQYSLAPVASRLAERFGVPVLSGPHRAATELRAAIENRGETS